MDISGIAIAASSQQDSGRITSITIENFKGIGDAVTIPIRPITLLFGKNSAGKSTVLQALRYWFDIWNRLTELMNERITERITKPERITELMTELMAELSTIKMSGGRTIDFRDFPSLVHRHELDRKIRIRIEYTSTIGDNDTQIYSWNEVVTGWKEGDTYVESILWGSGRNSEEICCILSGATPDDVLVGPNGKKLIRRENFLENFPFEIYVTTNPTKSFKVFLENMLSGPQESKKPDLPFLPLMPLFLGLAIAAVAVRKLAHTQQESKKRIGKLLRSLQESKKLDAIRHLGPFREVPPDDYKIPQTLDESPWEKGFGAWDVLARDPEAVKKTNHYMQDVLKLGYSINQSPDGEFYLHDDNNIDIGLSDVGVGISQVIPVLVGALDSQNLDIFAVEQPELHVHPAVQVALGDVFIDGIKNGNRTMLIETHSEHLLLRLLRRVRETNVRNSKKYEWRQSSMPPLHREMSEASIRDAENQDSKDHQLTPDDLAVIYVRPTPEGVKVTPLAVTNDGDFNAPWPEGFFDERVEELL